MAVCKYCAEEVQEAATVCPHCRKTIKYERTAWKSGTRFGLACAVLFAINTLFTSGGAFVGKFANQHTDSLCYFFRYWCLSGCDMEGYKGIKTA